MFTGAREDLYNLYTVLGALLEQFRSIYCLFQRPGREMEARGDLERTINGTALRVTVNYKK